MRTRLTSSEVPIGDGVQEGDWRTIASFPALSPREVQVWRKRVAGGPLDVWEQELPAAERARCRTYVQLADRERFAGGRCFLRRLLAAHLGEATLIVLGYGENGKPNLRDFPHLHFNMSHSGDWIVVAISESPIGVDVEQLRPFPDMDAVASSCFGAGELRSFHAASGVNRVRSFFRNWIHKEAYLKMRGCGLIDGLTEIDLEYAVSTSSIIRTEGERRERLAALEFEVAEGYLGSVVADRSAPDFLLFEVSPSRFHNH